ncbi:MAG TPA: ATP-dependent DNA helicase [Plantibacter sp.]|uniref:ATP-dependent DNA helicase n=1 Tax=unclassified Plantibacter TaxID=2624265 RepID=UPI002C90413E|nr:ATP-dependent DNA helicase [Plantibacter sp.]
MVDPVVQPAPAGARPAESSPHTAFGVVALDDSQRAVLGLDDTSHAAVLGAAGTGKTTTLVEAVAERVLDRGYSTDEVLVIAASRSSAQVLRDRLEARVARATPGSLARTAVSLALEIIAGSGAFAGAGRPRLLTGGEQDQTIAERLLGDELETTGPVWPAELGPEVRRLQGFRTELRNLMERSVEHAVAPSDLRRLGAEHERPEWIASAGFIEGFLADDWRGHLTPAAALARAARLLDEETPGTGVLGRLRAIFIDDAQEATHGVLELFAALARHGITIVAFGDPDLTTGAFHGARADALGRFADVLGRPVETLSLGRVHRGTPAIRTTVSGVTERIGTAGAGLHRAAAPPLADSTDPEHSVMTVAAGSPAEQIAVIARFLRERHVLSGVPWAEMAVVVRSGGLIPAIERGLSSLEVPTRASTGGSPLREQPFVRAVLLGVSVALGRTPLDADVVTELLHSALGGLDSIGVRRLRAALRHADLEHGLDRSADRLLEEAFAVPGALVGIETPSAAKARSLADSLAEARAQADAGASAEELVYGLWSRSRLERGWVKLSKGSGQAAEEANRDLDAITQLADAARTFVEAEPDTPASVFLDRLLEQAVGDDSLAPTGLRQAVTIATPAALVGSAFDSVVVAGMQDGVWPNLRVRDSLLGASALVELLEGTATPTADARRAVLHDELRLFAQASSRADRSLLVVAVVDDDHQASPFLTLVPEPDPHRVSLAPLSLRGLVGTLRRSLTRRARPADPAERRAAASALALLADAGVAGAPTEEWYGVAAPSSTAPLHDPAVEELPISPSRMEAFEACPLHWVIARLGGGASGFASGLGTIVHAALEHAESSDEAALWSAVEARWDELRFEAEWEGAATKRRAAELVHRLSAYLHDAERAGVTTIGNESRFSLRIPIGELGGAAVLGGSIDRVELVPELDGTKRVVIADLKTGGSAPRQDREVEEMPQLGAYQLALAEGSVPGTEGLLRGGAKLIVVSAGTQRKEYYDPAQPAFDDDALERFRARVLEDAIGMAGAVFEARLGTHCHDPFAFGECSIHIVPAVSS